MNKIEKWFIKQLDYEINNPNWLPNMVLVPFAIYYMYKWSNE